MTLVSVVTPSLNQAQFLQQTITSVLDQDHPEIELLVVDGGSTDGSLEVIRANSSRLAWWASEPDAGQADAINKGLSHAHGEIVAWLNSDDYYLPGAVRSAVRILEANPEAVAVYGDTWAVDAGGRVINKLRYPSVSLVGLLCFEIIGQPAVFIRRRALDAVGRLDPRFHLLLDHQLWIKLAALGPFIHANETWAAARFHPAAKNVAYAGLFGGEAFEILNWASQDPALASVLRPIRSRARAAANRVDARYLLDAGSPAASLRAWARSFVLHPATALARLNILASAILELLGLSAIRRRILSSRLQAPPR